jgi:hypothetical protein
MDTSKSFQKIDKSVFSVDNLSNQGIEKSYWLSLTPQQRLEALEFLRQQNYNYDPAASRLQRILEVTKLK